MENPIFRKYPKLGKTENPIFRKFPKLGNLRKTTRWSRCSLWILGLSIDCPDGLHHPDGSRWSMTSMDDL